MSLFPGRKLGILSAVFILGGVFLLISAPREADAFHATSSYNKLYNDTLTSDNWNDLFRDFVNNWLPVSLNGPVGIATGSPESGLEVNGPIRGASLFSSGNVGIGTNIPAAKLEVVAASGNSSILAGLKRIGNVDVPYDITDAATKGYVDSYVATATGTISTLWGGTTGGDIWSLNSGNVGIGTTTPAFKLDVNGHVAIRNGKVLYFFSPSNGQYTWISAATDSSLLFRNAANYDFQTYSAGAYSSKLYIKNNGDIGIGTSSPVVKLDVFGRGVFGSMAGSRNSYGNTLSLVNAASTDTSLFLWQSGVASGHFGFSSASNVLRIVNSTSDGSLTNAASINLTSTGNVGIGTAAPRKNLSVIGKINLGGAEDSSLDTYDLVDKGTNAGLYLWRNSDSPALEPFILVRSGTGALGSATSGGGQLRGLQAINGLSFNNAIDDTEWMRIQDGNLGIGTTSPAARLEVASPNNSSILAGLKRIGDVDIPFAVTDAATKGYVDSFVISYVAVATGTIANVAYYVGITPTAYNGNNNGTAGYVAAENACKAAFASSTVCTPDNILNSIAAGLTLPAEDVWIFAGPPGYTAAANDCEGRSIATTAAYGTYWQIPMTGRPQGRGLLMRCNNSLKLACCR